MSKAKAKQEVATETPELELEAFAAPVRSAVSRLPAYPTVFRFCTVPVKFNKPAGHVGKAPQYTATIATEREEYTASVPGAIASFVTAEVIEAPFVYKDGSLFRVKNA